MLLVLTSSDDATADYLCARLTAEHAPFLRIDTDTFARTGFVEYCHTGITIRIGDRSYSPDAFSNLWFRRPRGILVEGPSTPAQLLHTSREWGAALDGFLAHIASELWINHPAANARASSKLHQLSAAQALGLSVPDTLVTMSNEEALRFWYKHGGFVVTKPLSVGYVESPNGVVEGRIYTSSVKQEDLRDTQLLSRCPTLLQQQISGGVDVRLTVIDGKFVASHLRPPKGTPPPVNIRRLDMTRLNYNVASVPAGISSLLLQLMDSFRLRFGAIDLIETAGGEWVFLEINPNGQWAWMDLIGVSNIAQLFLDALGGNRW